MPQKLAHGQVLRIADMEKYTVECSVLHLAMTQHIAECSAFVLSAIMGV